MPYTNAWDKTTPTDSTPANTIDDIFRAMKTDLEERVSGLLGTGAWTGVDPLALGNISIGGTLGVVGAATLSSTLNVVGNLSVNTNKFNVTAASGNTTIAGTLGVTGATTLSSTLGVTGATTLAALTATTGSFSSTLNVVGNFTVNTNKLIVTAASGNTTIAGTLGVTGTTTLAALNSAAIVSSASITGATSILVTGAAATGRGFFLQTGGVNRASLTIDNGAESGSDAGSSVRLSAYDDTGAFIDSPIAFSRASGSTISISRAVAITGSLTTSQALVSNNGTVSSSSAAGTSRVFQILTSGTLRWALAGSTDAETGSDAGTKLNINAYTDAGAYIDSPISIIRAASGILGINRPTTITGAVIINNSQFTANSGTLTVSTPHSFNQTWNNAGTTFKVLQLNITDTASAATSILYEANVSGSPVFRVLKSGIISVGGYQGTAIADTYLATISTAGKVSNSATTATSANTVSAIVARDGSGNFSAGTITAALSGNSSTATKLQTARLINGVSFDGSADISISATADAGTLTGTTLAAGVTASSLTSVGTLTSLTLGGNLTFSGTSLRIIPSLTDIGFRNSANSANNLLITDGGNITVRGTISGVTTLTATTLAGTLSTAAQTNITSVGTLTSLTLSGNLTFSGASKNIVAGTTNLSIRNNANSADNLLIADAGAITVRSTISGVTTLTATTVTATTLTGTLSTAAQTSITSVGTLTSLLINTGSITSNTPVDITTTWNAGAIVFKAFTINITNTASSASSVIADFKVGGSSVFTIDTAGVITNASLSGNAATATKLQTARTINGVSFDGTANITITAAADAGTLTGTTLAAGVTASSLTSLGTLTALTINGNLTFSGASRQIIPGTTSLTFRNNANNANNLVINDNGDMSFRGALSGITTLNATTVGATTITGTIGTAAQTSITSLGTLTSLTLSGAITFTGGNKIVPSAKFVVRDPTDISDVFSIASTVDHTVTTSGAITAGGLITANSGIALGGNLDLAGNNIMSASKQILKYISGTPDKVQVGLASSGIYAMLDGNSNASLPSATAGNNGIVTIDTTNNRLCYWSGGSRYYLVGTSF